jgi:hypothetical protein
VKRRRQALRWTDAGIVSRETSLRQLITKVARTYGFRVSRETAIFAFLATPTIRRRGMAFNARIAGALPETKSPKCRHPDN